MDHLANFCTHIRNAVMAGHLEVDLPAIKMNKNLLDVMKQHHFITGYVAIVPKKSKFPVYRVKFNIVDDSGFQRNAIGTIKQISKPSLRVSRGYKEMYPLKGLGISIYSTSKGYKDGMSACKEKTGGIHLINVSS